MITNPCLSLDNYLMPVSLIPIAAGNFTPVQEQNWIDVCSWFWWAGTGASRALVSLFVSSENYDEVERARLAAIEREQLFHENIRQLTILLLLAIIFYSISYWIISRFKSKAAHDSLYAGDEDYFVYRISCWKCTGSLAVSLGSVALLPFSIIGFELIQRYPDNYYLQWLSTDLISRLWNHIFILSNVSLFVVLPFSYFFIESQGFRKKKNGIMQRVYETMAVCALLIFVLLCLADVVIALIAPQVSLISLTSVNLPLIYSCVSLCGVLLLLLSAPIGLAKMFRIVADLTMTTTASIDDQTAERLERQYQIRRAIGDSIVNNNVLRGCKSSPDMSLYQRYLPSSKRHSPAPTHGNDCGDYSMSGAGDGPSETKSDERIITDTNNYNLDSLPFSRPLSPSYVRPWAIFGLGSTSDKNDKHTNAIVVCVIAMFWFWAPLRRQSLRWYQQLMESVKYPIVVSIISTLTAISLLMVVINSLKLILGYRGLPVYARYMEVNQRHSFGMAGAILESTIILYIMATSLVGVYTVPFIKAIRPTKGGTSMTAIIINCSLVLVLSSALPVLATTLGMTSFSLLGLYSSLEWLSNFHLVVAYNLLFTAVSVLSLSMAMTVPVKNQIAKIWLFIRCGRRKREESVDKSE